MAMKRGLVLALLLSGLAGAEPPPPQPLSPESFVKLRYVRDGAARPDGTSLVYTVSSETPEDPRFDRQRFRSQNDVWIYEKGEARQLMGDAIYPSWSPDGSAVAVLQADADQARLKVWWAANGQWSVLRHAIVGRGDGPGYCWLPDNRVLAVTHVLEKPREDIVVLDSQEKNLAPRHLLIDWNPDTGVIREWGQGSFQHFSAAPNGKRVAVWRQDRLPFPSGKAAAPSRLVLLELGQPEKMVPGIVDPRPDSLRWSADGSQLAVADAYGRWWQVSTVSGEARAAQAGVRDCAWLDNQPVWQGSESWMVAGQPLLPASGRVFGTEKGGGLGLDQGQLYRLSADGRTSALQAVPGQGELIWEQDQRWPLVVRRGARRTRIDADGSMRTSPADSDRLLVGSSASLWLVNLEQTRVHREDGQPGPQLSSLESRAVLKSIPAGTAQTVDWLLTPEGGSGPYPVVVWLEPGRIYSPQQPPIEAVLSNRTSSLNAHLLTSQGYAVYFPSLAGGQRREPAALVKAGLEAALTRLKSRPELDSNRLAVLGHGYGGYGALLSLTQGAPFKAAIVVNPIVDPGGDYARVPVGSQDALESSHARSHFYETSLGAAPWGDPQLYLRNSPYYLAGRVNSPVLLISGGKDEHQTQSEQFFQALYRQGKPARLVRYADEQALVSRADHVQHQWDQIYTWLARYLGDGSAAHR